MVVPQVAPAKTKSFSPVTHTHTHDGKSSAAIPIPIPSLRLDPPFGALKCNTFPSSLNMLTSSTPVIGCTFSFFSAPWSFLSSCAFAGFDLRTTFRRTVPFPPDTRARARVKRWTSATHTKLARSDTTRKRRNTGHHSPSRWFTSTYLSCLRPPALAAWPVLRDPCFRFCLRPLNLCWSSAKKQGLQVGCQILVNKCIFKTDQCYATPHSSDRKIVSGDFTTTMPPFLLVHRLVRIIIWLWPTHVD